MKPEGGDSTVFSANFETAFRAEAAAAGVPVPADFAVNAVSEPTTFETPTTLIHDESTEEDETGSYEDLPAEEAALASPTSAQTMVPHVCATCEQVPCGQCQTGCPVSACEGEPGCSPDR